MTALPSADGVWHRLRIAPETLADSSLALTSTDTIVVRDGRRVGEADLRRHCAERLARFKVPKSFEVVERLPRTASGKLLRRELDGATRTSHRLT